MKFFTNEVKIATVAIVGVVLLFFGINFMKGHSVFSDNNTYYIRFADISGLSNSNPIYANGFKVGLVDGISYDYDGGQGVIVALDVNKNLKIPHGSKAVISSDLMGNVKMNLLLADSANGICQPGDTLSGSLEVGLQEAVAQLMPAIKQLIPKADSILTSVNTLMADPAIAKSLHNVQRVSAELTTTTASLNRLITNLNTRMPGLMNKTEMAIGKANVTLDNTSQITANLAAIDIEGTMSKVNNTLDNVQNITAKMNSKHSTLGLLLSDPTLYNNLNSTLMSADSLVTNFKAHPKRYIHFSIFGRRDK